MIFNIYKYIQLYLQNGECRGRGGIAYVLSRWRKRVLNEFLQKRLIYIQYKVKSETTIMKRPISLMFVLIVCLMQFTFAAYLRKATPKQDATQIKQEASVQYSKIDLENSAQQSQLNFVDVEPQFQQVDIENDPTILKNSVGKQEESTLKPFSDYEEYDENVINNLETQINREQQIEKNIKKDEDALSLKEQDLEKENAALQEIQDKNMIATGQITYEEVAERERMLHEQMQQLTFERTKLSQESLEEEQEMNQLQTQEDSLKMLPQGVTKEYFFAMMPVEQDMLMNPPQLEEFDNDLASLTISKTDIEKEMGFSFAPEDSNVEDPSQLSDDQVESMKKQRNRQDLEPAKKQKPEEAKQADPVDQQENAKLRNPDLPRVKNAHIDYANNDNGPQYVPTDKSGV